MSRVRNIKRNRKRLVDELYESWEQMMRDGEAKRFERLHPELIDEALRMNLLTNLDREGFGIEATALYDGAL